MFSETPLLLNSIVTKSIYTLARAANYVPQPIKRSIALPLLDRVFYEAIADGELDFMTGKILKIHITDVGIILCFGFFDQRLELHDSIDSDVCISGKLDAFICLASRQEDPDTLFFQRRLMIEGDTELGLAFKNMLDSIDYDTLPISLGKGLKLLATRFS